ncbi:MAG: exodeoxyribonuclease V subunit beta [Deltaproteobacteria bacterium]|nr:exodeoxyribonuclease V subunit beta [Deltaproteobacteria bacterium]
METFDLLQSPLTGSTLIEASAGTGKTYAVAGLYVRLVVELGIPVREILVVTYTIAATGELRDRIRRRLREAEEAFREGESTDAFLAGLLAKLPLSKDRRRAGLRLRTAVRDFDEASIHTIHGFCQRMLQEHAFESGNLFDSKLLPDDGALKAEIVQDFWRRHFYEAPPEFVGHALSKKVGPDRYLEWIGRPSSNPDLVVLPDARPPSEDEIEGAISDFRKVYGALRTAWPEGRGEVIEILKGPALKANVYGRRVDGLIDLLDDYLYDDTFPFPPPADIERFTAAVLEKATKKNAPTPRHGVFTLCQELLESAGDLAALLDRRLLHLKAEAIRVSRRELPARKAKRHVLSYDDLLVRLRDALYGPTGPALLASLGRKYRCALIDEFQDTDPIQYAIFDALFRKRAGSESGGSSCLFLIGDPKQAIYSFRGADVFAYMRAAAQADRRYTLAENWRSEPGLVAAVNRLFGGASRPFVYEPIAFHHTRAGQRPGQPVLTFDGQTEAPLQWWLLSEGDGGSEGSSTKPLPKTEAVARIAGAVAGEIRGLLSLGRRGRAMIGGRPLSAGDIAVLVRKNRQARVVQEALQRLRIPCVVSSEESVFAGPEALTVERIIAAIDEPADEGLVRAALITDLLGLGGEALDGLLRDDRSWEARLKRFHLYHDIWQNRGFIQMFRLFMAAESVRSRLLAFPDGERRLTNVLHIAELLHEAAVTENLTARGLMQWMRGQRRRGDVRPEEQELRLESDARAVRIVTIHKSKGLEYPVVFCPYAWEGSRIAKGRASRPEILFFHDPGRDHALVCDIGSPDLPENLKLAEREALAENCRLLYVALTRAKHRCYFVWGRINEAETSAPAYLFHRRGDGDPDDPVAETARRLADMDGELMAADLAAIARESGGSIHLCPLPAAETVPLEPDEGVSGGALRCREFSGSIDRSWRIASFSLLASGGAQAAELPDRDALQAPDGLSPAIERLPEMDEETAMPGIEAPVDPEGIFAFPKGAAAGTVLHEIFEDLDFQEKEGTVIGSIVSRCLRRHGFSGIWEKAVTAMIERVLRFPLAEGRNSGKDLILADVPLEARLNELAFFFPLRRIGREALASLFREAGSPPGRKGEDLPERLERLQFSPLRGFMRGFIDCVFRHEGRFYLVDWKSNHLGNRITDYHQAALAKTMMESLYVLQYHLYTVALHRYLKLRLPGYGYESHFGGVFYCFVRGMDPAVGASCGLYRDRPRVELVEELGGRLIAT